ncbi:acetolactate synthase small subunit [Halobacteriaceae archaeon GCM10025711]
MSRGLQGPAPEERPKPAGRRNAQGIRIDPEVEAEQPPRREVLSALVAHEPGVLAKVSGLFARRQFNIESLAVGPTSEDDLARITIVVEEPEPGIEQVKRQLNKLVPVRSVTELAGAVERELALIKVSAKDPSDVTAVAEMFNGTSVDACPETVTVEVTGTEAEIDRAVAAFDRFEVQEVVRTGTAALAQGTEETA